MKIEGFPFLFICEICDMLVKSSDTGVESLLSAACRNLFQALICKSVPNILQGFFVVCNSKIMSIVTYVTQFTHLIMVCATNYMNAQSLKTV